jgi:hypothetical protein
VRNRKPWVPPSEPVTGVGVTDRQGEKAEAERQEDDVKHCGAPFMRAVCGGATLQLGGGE